jgi:hypothetical protein
MQAPLIAATNHGRLMRLRVGAPTLDKTVEVKVRVASRLAMACPRYQMHMAAQRHCTHGCAGATRRAAQLPGGLRGAHYSWNNNRGHCSLLCQCTRAAAGPTNRGSKERGKGHLHWPHPLLCLHSRRRHARRCDRRRQPADSLGPAHFRTASQSAPGSSAQVGDRAKGTWHNASPPQRGRAVHPPTYSAAVLPLRTPSSCQGKAQAAAALQHAALMAVCSCGTFAAAAPCS